ncbi:tyrosine-type recombinase/integrase, partial [Pseudomonas sp.]|uniref:tyrosine-type recombinase/integrase n=2 Tax=Pseudomonas TaxID=286 RepID=UPI003918189B
MLGPLKRHLKKVIEHSRPVVASLVLPRLCCALKLAPLLFCRPGDLRHMEWSEVNLDAGEWLIPGHKMKGLTATKQDRPDHLVPLSQQAIAVLRELKPLTGRHRYAFPSAR